MQAQAAGMPEQLLLFMISPSDKATANGVYTTPVTVAFYGENSANAQAFSSTSSPASRSRLSGVSTIWTIPSSNTWVQGQIRQSPDITAIVQAIVDLSGWQSVNMLAILVELTSDTTAGAYRQVSAFQQAGIASSPNLVIQTGPHRIFLPLVGKNFPVPLTSPSYYIQEVSTIKDKGTILGNHARNTPGTQDYLVILVYGYPGQDPATGQYGAFYTFSPDTFINSTTIVNSASDFARNFYYASGSDITSKLRLVIGVNNCCDGVPLSIFRNHGTVWGNIVNSIKSNIDACCSSQVSVVAGLDAEREWVHGIVLGSLSSLV
jgi:hypothetical protein